MSGNLVTMSTIAEVVSFALPLRTKSEHGLCITVDLRAVARDPGGELVDLVEEAAVVRYVFQRELDRTYIRVWAAEVGPQDLYVPVERFKLYAWHDSAWRYDGLRLHNLTVRKLEDAVRQHHPRDGVTVDVYGLLSLQWVVVDYDQFSRAASLRSLDNLPAGVAP